MTEERKQELDREWNECDLMDDEEYRDWYEGLTDEEQALIDAWDKQYQKGALRICEEILAREEQKPSLEYQVAVAQAEQLRQRAERIPGSEDILWRLNDLLRVARRTQKAEYWQGNVKGLTDELTALESQIRARETRTRQEQKEDRETIDAVGKLANDLTERLPR